MHMNENFDLTRILCEAYWLKRYEAILEADTVPPYIMDRCIKDLFYIHMGYFGSVSFRRKLMEK